MKAMTTIVLSGFAGLLIGGFLSLVGIGGSLAVNLLISLCAGLCISAAAELAEHVSAGQATGRRLLALALAVAIGSVPPVAVGLAAVGPQAGDQQLDTIFKIITISLVFGSVLTAIFVLFRRRHALQRELADAELRRTEAERRRLETHLRMLQAQIEPHFLFNTLATLAGLIEIDAPRARELLDKLVVYLRATLSQARSTGGTLGDELDLAATYLEICRVRVGGRLNYEMTLGSDLRALPFPPMLVQPLVENAVKHGVEPKPGPVAVRIAAEAAEGRLTVIVTDDGIGLGDTAGGGFGLENVQARLAALYGQDARLTLEERPTGGVAASIAVPVPSRHCGGGQGRGCARPARGDTARGDTARGDTARGDTARGDTARGDTASPFKGSPV